MVPPASEEYSAESSARRSAAPTMHRRVLCAFDFLNSPSRAWALNYVLGWDDGMTNEDLEALARPTNAKRPAPFCFVAVGSGAAASGGGEAGSARQRGENAAGAVHASEMIYNWYPVASASGVTVGVAVERIGFVDGFRSFDAPTMPKAEDGQLRPLGRFAADDTTGEVISVSTTQITANRFPGAAMACISHIRIVGEVQTVTFIHCVASQLRSDGRSKATAADFSNSVVVSSSVALKRERCSGCGVLPFPTGACNCPSSFPIPGDDDELSLAQGNVVSATGNRLPGAESLLGEFAGHARLLMRTDVAQPLQHFFRPRVRAKVMFMSGAAGDSLASEMQALAIRDTMGSAPPKWPLELVGVTRDLLNTPVGPAQDAIDTVGCLDMLHPAKDDGTLARVRCPDGRVGPSGVSSAISSPIDDLEPQRSLAPGVGTASSPNVFPPVESDLDSAPANARSGVLSSDTVPQDGQGASDVIEPVLFEPVPSAGVAGVPSNGGSRSGPSSAISNELLRAPLNQPSRVAGFATASVPEQGIAAAGDVPASERKEDRKLDFASSRLLERKRKNRLAAQRSNARRKQYQEDLERSVEQIRVQHAELVARQAALRADNTRLKMRVWGSERGPTCRPPP